MFQHGGGSFWCVFGATKLFYVFGKWNFPTLPGRPSNSVLSPGVVERLVTSPLTAICFISQILRQVLGPPRWQVLCDWPFGFFYLLETDYICVYHIT